MNPYSKPLPEMLSETAGFWEATTRGELVIQKCLDCGALIYFPRMICPHCLSRNLGWKRASGRGTIHSYTIMHRVLYDSFADDVPYVYAIIDLEEGVRMTSNVINIAPEAVHVGLPVKVTFIPANADIAIPVFEPIPKIS